MRNSFIASANNLAQFLYIPDIAFARYLIIENFVVMADRIDEKTCTGHGTRSNVRTGYQCIAYLLTSILFKGTKWWSYSDGSYRYLDPHGSTYYQDGNCHAIYDRYFYSNSTFIYILDSRHPPECPSPRHQLLRTKVKV